MLHKNKHQISARVLSIVSICHATLITSYNCPEIIKLKL